MLAAHESRVRCPGPARPRNASLRPGRAAGVAARRVLARDNEVLLGRRDHRVPCVACRHAQRDPSARLENGQEAIELTKPQLAKEAVLAAMVNSASLLPSFYFSHAIDLTRSAQQRAEFIIDSHAPATPDFATADFRLVWNGYGAKKVTERGGISWIVNLIWDMSMSRMGCLTERLPRCLGFRGALIAQA